MTFLQSRKDNILYKILLFGDTFSIRFRFSHVTFAITSAPKNGCIRFEKQCYGEDTAG